LILEIIQTWKTTSGLPPILAQSAATWRSQHPEVAYRLVDDDFVWSWLESNLDKFPHAIQTGKPNIRTVDMFRYCHLLLHGGLYVDLDFYCLKPVTSLVERYPDSVVLGSMNMPPSRLLHSVPNAWMYSARAGLPFWLLVLDLASTRKDADWIEYATGPVLLYSALEIYRQMRSGEQLKAWGNVATLANACGVDIPAALPPVVVLPPTYLYPLSWADDTHRPLIEECRGSNYVPPSVVEQVTRMEDSYAFTFWYHSWGVVNW
jgi:hypothetical protein